MEDLFESPENLPQEVKDILKKYEDSDFTYDVCSSLVEDLEAVGYTCDYGLDASPYDLRVLDPLEGVTCRNGVPIDKCNCC